MAEARDLGDPHVLLDLLAGSTGGPGPVLMCCGLRTLWLEASSRSNRIARPAPEAHPPACGSQREAVESAPVDQTRRSQADPCCAEEPWRAYRLAGSAIAQLPGFPSRSCGRWPSLARRRSGRAFPALSIQFRSSSLQPRAACPADPQTRPVQDGTGGTFNCHLPPAFWFGLAMCDAQSAPNPGGSPLGAPVPSTADSDTNIFNSSDPASPSYIGRHPGTAFMEMQFYPPGWAPWPAGNSCAATQWCAALTIDSLSQNLNTGQQLNPTCAAITGIDYVNFAFITKSGVAQAPASPVNATLATFTPDPAKDLFMNSGDTLKVRLHDTSGGFQVVIDDQTTGQSGSMTASAANDFGEVHYAPTGTTCTNIPTNFH